MNFLTEKAQALAVYTVGLQPREPGWIKLNTNENPYPPAPGVNEAIRGADIAELRLYPEADCTELNEAIAGAVGVEAENIFCGNGSDEVLALAFQAFFTGKSPILCPDITYGFYPVWAKAYDAALTIRPLADDFTINPSDYTDAAGVVIANPNAPTGTALGLSEVEKILRSNPRGLVLVDEAYIDFADVPSAVPLIAKYENLLVVRTFSKSHSLAGLRVGYAVGGPPLISGLRRLRDAFNSFPLDRLAQKAAVAAIRDSAYLRECVARIKATRDRTADCLRGLGYTVLPSQGSFFFMEAPDAAGLYKHLLANKILVRHWNAPRIDRFLRVSVGTDAEMEAFVTCVRQF